MAINPAPGGDVIECSRIGAHYFQGVTHTQFLNLVLGADYRHGAEHATGIELMVAHSTLNIPAVLHLAGLHRADFEFFHFAVTAAYFHADFVIILAL